MINRSLSVYLRIYADFGKFEGNHESAYLAKILGILILPRDDVIVIDKFKIFKARFYVVSNNSHTDVWIFEPKIKN